MNRVSKTGVMTAAMLLVLPATAFAQSSVAGEISVLRIGVSLAGLVVAIVLLLEVLGVRRVSLGGAIAEKISYVVLAVLCLAASALAQWASNFAQGITLDQTQLASQLLVILAMALFAAYFFSVSRAMRRFLKAMTESQSVAEQPTVHPDDDRDGAASADSAGASGA